MEARGTSPGKGRLADLTPLTGLALTTLRCGNNPITDLTPLRMMPLKTLTFGSGEVAQIRVEVPQPLHGRAVQDVTVPGDIAVAVIVRGGRALVPTLGTRFEAGDVARFIVARGAYSRFESFLGMRG